jgi:ribosomal protein S18 acetylase RimI-like enzyme
MTMELTFRSAKPADVDHAVPLVHSSDVKSLDYILNQGNKTALDFLRFAFLQGGGLFGHQNLVVAETQGRVVAAVAFNGGSELQGLGIAMGKQILRFYGLRASLPVFKRSLIMRKLSPPMGEDTEYASSLGVAPDFRGRGIGSALLNRHKEVARAKGRRVYALDVSVDNHRAQELYERLGFQVTRENRLNGFMGCTTVPDTRRMEMNL